MNRTDSEIALTALLSALVAGYPISSLSLYPHIKATAFGLLLLTLARRIGVVNGLTGNDVVIRTMSYVMDPATYLSFLYLAYWLMRWAIGSPADPVVFGIVTTGLVFVLFLLSELLFGAALGEGERIFSASAEKHQGEVLGAALSRLADHVRQSHSRSGDTTRQVKLTHPQFYNQTIDDYSPEEQVRIVQSTLVMFTSILLSIVGYGLLAAVGMWLFGVGWLSSLMILFSVMFVSAFFRIWYSNYGLVPVEDRNGYVTFFGDSLVFLVVGLMVF